MLSNVHGSSWPPRRRERVSRSGVPVASLRAPTRPGRLTLDAGALLFEAGAPRDRLYRIEVGAVCHYITWADGRHEVIEFLFPGDIVGFGFVERHVSSAQAVSAVVVSVLAPEAFERALEDDAGLSLRVSSAADREFEVTRSRALARGGRSAKAKVAAYLLALSGLEGGGGAAVVSDDDLGGFAADRLGLSRVDFDRAVASLIDDGMVARSAAGLVVADRVWLTAAADG